MEEKYYSVEQIATMIDMHPKTIQRYLREGKLKAQKIGKSWRVSGHDLSTFVEGTEADGASGVVHGVQAIIGAAMENIRVSTVIDIPVKSSADAVQIVNWVTSSMNSKSPESVQTSMTSQYIESEHLLRIMLWGSPSFMEIIMNSFANLGHCRRKQNE